MLCFVWRITISWLYIMRTRVMEQQWIVAYIISHIMTLCCLTFYILIFERVLWFNHLYEMVEYCNCTIWDIWCTHMSNDENGWLMCMFGMSKSTQYVSVGCKICRGQPTQSVEGVLKQIFTNFEFLTSRPEETQKKTT